MLHTCPGCDEKQEATENANNTVTFEPHISPKSGDNCPGNGIPVVVSKSFSQNLFARFALQ